MAETFSKEGLTHIFGIWPKNGTNDSSLYLGLFSSQTASTVPTWNTVVLATPTGVTEASGTGSDYARVAMAAAGWGSATESGSGVRVTRSASADFPESGAAYDDPVNGFFIATASTAGVSIGFSNFSDTTAVDVSGAGFTIRVTPYIHIDA
jgi:hypothetical protein